MVPLVREWLLRVAVGALVALPARTSIASGASARGRLHKQVVDDKLAKTSQLKRTMHFKEGYATHIRLARL